ncbi:alanine racemase [Jiangella aurantiaca]|uniref:Alanine racemase n=1 Tax=Jiangella aurantiaca TaxID=2530373 RepID=A0A4R5AHQ0_9ACTN|nr:alanine racemase [Jiangella aurantiaca]TDD72228.1 alanine racemase [Jiangella aurantiaca]
MSLTLHIAAGQWRGRVRRYVEDATEAGVTVVPVAKGNGYGFGNAVLAAEAARLRVATLAAGTYEEVPAVTGEFGGDVLVLTPWRPWLAGALGDDRVVHTVSRLEDLRQLAAGTARPRVVVEVLTSMRRHGIVPGELAETAKLLDDVRFEGFALHLPLAGDHTAEATTLARQAFEAVPAAARTIWVSHLTAARAAAVGIATSAEVRLRVATALWLGDRSGLTPKAAVLDVHRVRRGETYGYRQRRARRDGTVVVVAGGTAHGIALQAPTAASTLRQRATALARGGLEAGGRALSPFRVAGKQRWFAEPPHMQCSMIWLPDGVEPPAVGDEADVEVRFTTTSFDTLAWD